MAKISYYEKLKDPRWQKKRLEVMEHNDFHCEICGDGTSTLNVHHKEYFKGREPWDYEREQLACICESCHEQQHQEVDLLKWVCSYANLDGPRNRTELAFLLSGYMGIPYQDVLKIAGIEHHASYEITHSVGDRSSDVANQEILADYKRRNPENG